MKKIFFAILILLAVRVSAQDLRTNNHAILFSFSGLSDLGLNSYNGGTNYAGIGAKLVNQSGEMALRPAFVFSGGSTLDEAEAVNFIGEKRSNFTVGILVDVIKHLNKNNILPFIGVGMGFVTSKQKTEPAHAENQKADNTETNVSGFLIRGILGAEVFIKKNISLSWEYQLSYMKGTNTNKYTNGTGGLTVVSKNKTFNFGLEAVGRLTLAVYLN
jgi:hypothetical protein